jgi:D-glycero-alpha-D-manno-heptose 1-phosphate guanylyltransferase
MDRTIKEAIILAGGFGSRLKSEIGDLPKVLAPINDIPFLNYVLDYLIENEIQRAVLSVGYRWDEVMETYGDYYQDLELRYVVENDPLGTGGGIRLAMDHLEGSSFFAMNGDTLFTIPLALLSETHFLHEADCSIALKEMSNVDRYGNVEMQGERIVRFTEKKFRNEALINGGIYCLNKTSMSPFMPGQAFSFEKDYLETDTNQKSLYGKVFDDYFIDIGIPEDYRKFQDEML